MTIRPATKWDLDAVLDMLRHFRNATPIDLMNTCDNEIHVNKIYHSILAGMGLALIAERDSQPVGMILGIINPTVWDPNIRVLHELCFWVEPEHRGTTAGYRLLKAYGEAAEQLKKQGRIHMYTMTKMVNSPDIDYGRFGYRKSEETWVGGV